MMGTLDQQQESSLREAFSRCAAEVQVPAGTAERLAGRDYRPRGRPQVLATRALASAIVALAAAAVALPLTVSAGGGADAPGLSWVLAGSVRSEAGYTPSPWVTASPGLAVSGFNFTCPSATTCYLAGGVAAKPGAASGSAAGWAEPGAVGVEVTHDGGATWHVTRLDDILPISNVSCPSPAVCVLLGARTDHRPVLVETTDGGVTWVAHSAPGGLSSSYGMNHGSIWVDPVFLSCPSATSCTVAVSPAGGEVWGVTPTSRVFVTTDGGRAWSSSSLQIFPTGLQCFANGKCFSGGPVATAYSTDNGLTWSVSPFRWQSNGGQPVFSCARPARCEAVIEPAPGAPGLSAVVASSDGGKSWSRVSAHGFPSGRGFTDLTCPTSSECWLSGKLVHIATPGGSMNNAWGISRRGGAVLSTANGGQTWRASRLPVGVSGVLDLSCPNSSTCFALAAEQQPTSSSVGQPNLMLLVHRGPVS